MTRSLHKVMALLGAICISSKALALDSQIYLAVEALVYNDIAPINQFLEDLRGDPIDRGSLAFTSNRIELGQRFFLNDKQASFDFKVFSRFDYNLSFTPDMAQLLYLKSNRLPVPTGDMYDVALEGNHLRGSGISIGYNGKLTHQLEYTVSLSYLKATEMLYGGLAGEISSLDESARGNIDLDYYYSKDILFERAEVDSSGDGYSLDAALLWSPTARIELGIRAQDLYSGIRWRQQQRTVANVTSNRASADSSGASHVRAMLVWQETNANITQELPRRLTLRQSYRLRANDQVFLEQFIYSGRVFKRTGYSMALGASSHLQAFYDFDAGALGVELKLPYIRLSVFSDSTDLDDARVLGTTLTVAVPLAF